MTVIRWTSVGAALILLALALYLGSMRLGLWNPSLAQVKAAQAGPPSRFVKVGDVTVHYRDEGKGPVVLMLHSSMTNLRIWDGWADQLKGSYRVVRLDWPPYGLSTDPRPSTGSRGVAQLVERFVDELKLDDITLVGSSSGATLSVLYAAKYPQRVRALALSALPLAAPPPTEVSAWSDTMTWVHENIVPNYYPRYFYANSLAQLYGTPSRLKPETVDWYYQTNNVEGGFARVRAYYQANLKGLWKKGASDDAGALRVPILLQWGDRDRVLPKYLADKAVRDFANAKVELIHYPDVGHYPMLELPVETGRDLKAFLDRVTAAPKAAPKAAPAAAGHKPMTDPTGEWAFTGTAFQTDGTPLYTFTARTTIVTEAGGAVQVIVRTDQKESRSVSAPALPRPQEDGGALLFYDYTADPAHAATEGHDFFGMTRLRFAPDGQSATGNYMNYNGRYTCGECRLERI